MCSYHLLKFMAILPEAMPLALIGYCSNNWVPKDLLLTAMLDLMDDLKNEFPGIVFCQLADVPTVFGIPEASRVYVVVKFENSSDLKKTYDKFTEPK